MSYLFGICILTVTYGKIGDTIIGDLPVYYYFHQCFLFI